MQTRIKFIAYVGIAAIMVWIVYSEHQKSYKHAVLQCGAKTLAEVVKISSNNSVLMLTFEFKCKNISTSIIVDAPLHISVGDKYEAITDTCTCMQLQVDYTKPVLSHDELIEQSTGTIYKVKSNPVLGQYYIAFEFKTKKGKTAKRFQHIDKAMFQKLKLSKSNKKFDVLYARDNPVRSIIILE
jgi:hypothetical protein